MSPAAYLREAKARIKQRSSNETVQLYLAGMQIVDIAKYQGINPVTVSYRLKIHYFNKRKIGNTN